MVIKKPDRNHVALSRRSLVSSGLEMALTINKQMPLSDEPWRIKKTMGKNRGKRKK